LFKPAAALLDDDAAAAVCELTIEPAGALVVVPVVAAVKPAPEVVDEAKLVGPLGGVLVAVGAPEVVDEQTTSFGTATGGLAVAQIFFAYWIAVLISA
jgi:hypothetical protein